MVKKDFRLMVLQAQPNEAVMLGLVPIYSASSEEFQRSPDPEKVLVGPAIQSEDAKVVSDGIRAVFGELRRQGALPPSPSSPAAPMLLLQLTKEEYEQLGKPTPNEIVRLTLSVDRDPESKIESQRKSEDEQHV